jgi:hypothetical protein
VQSGMLLMWDRGLHSYKMVQATLEQKRVLFKMCQAVRLTSLKKDN